MSPEPERVWTIFVGADVGNPALEFPRMRGIKGQQVRYRCLSSSDIPSRLMVLDQLVSSAA